MSERIFKWSNQTPRQRGTTQRQTNDEHIDIEHCLVASRKSTAHQMPKTIPERENRRTHLAAK